jgi:hypothetical protein
VKVSLRRFDQANATRHLSDRRHNLTIPNADYHPIPFGAPNLIRVGPTEYARPSSTLRLSGAKNDAPLDALKMTHLEAGRFIPANSITGVEWKFLLHMKAQTLHKISFNEHVTLIKRPHRTSFRCAHRTRDDVRFRRSAQTSNVKRCGGSQMTPLLV